MCNLYSFLLVTVCYYLMICLYSMLLHLVASSITVKSSPYSTAERRRVLISLS